MEMYIATVTVVIFFSCWLSDRVTCYLTAYSWPVTILLQFATTMMVTSNPNVSAPPFCTTVKLLLIANIVIIAFVARLYAYNYLPIIIKLLGMPAV